MSITPNQSKESNKPSLEDDEIDRSLGKIQSLAQYYGSIQFGTTYPPRATALYDPTPLSQVQIVHYLTDREIIDADPLLLEVERELMEGLADEKGLPSTDTVSTSSVPSPSACQLSDISTIPSTKRSFGEIGESCDTFGEIDEFCDSFKKSRLDSWSGEGITQ